MFDRILVANRGEVAVRVIRALHELGIEAVAVYSTADEGALHVRLADRAVRIGPPPAALSYLSIPAIVAAATTSGSEAVHPGYGFLARGAGGLLRARLGGGGGRVLERDALRREGDLAGAARRGAGALRRVRRRAHVRGARVLDPAAAPEADRGVAFAGARRRAAGGD